MAAALGGGVSAGAWFDYDEAYNRVLDKFQGITFALSYGGSVEIGEVNRVTPHSFERRAPATPLGRSDRLNSMLQKASK